MGNCRFRARAGATLVRTGSPQQASPGTAPRCLTEHRQTDSNVSTHGQLTDTTALGPPHPGLMPLTSRLCGGSAPGGCQGLLAERTWQPSSQPSPAHGSAPARLPLPDPGAVGRGCCPVPTSPAQLGQQHPSPAPKHAGFSMQFYHAQRDPGPQEHWVRLCSRGAPGAAARAPEQPLTSLAHQKLMSPYLLFSPAPPVVLALGSLRKDKKEEEELKSMIIIANLPTVNAICSLTGKTFEYKYEHEHYLPGHAGKPALVKSQQPGWGFNPGWPSPDAEQQHRLPALCTGRWEQEPCLQLCQHTSNLTQLLWTTDPFLGFLRTLQAQPWPHTQPTAQRGWIGHSRH